MISEDEIGAGVDRGPRDIPGSAGVSWRRGRYVGVLQSPVHYHGYDIDAHAQSAYFGGHRLYIERAEGVEGKKAVADIANCLERRDAVAGVVDPGGLRDVAGRVQPRLAMIADVVVAKPGQIDPGVLEALHIAWIAAKLQAGIPEWTAGTGGPSRLAMARSAPRIRYAVSRKGQRKSPLVTVVTFTILTRPTSPVKTIVWRRSESSPT